MYLDLFHRRGKTSNAGNYMIRGACQRLDGSLQLPYVVLSCGFTRSLPRHPTLLDANEWRLFMHEAGHAMHGMNANYELKIYFVNFFFIYI